MLPSSAAGIVLLLQGTDLNILQTSENVEEFLGISAEELLCQPLQRLLPTIKYKKLSVI